MKSFELDLPTTDDEMCSWLERQLVSSELIDTVEKLHTLSGATQPKRVLIDSPLEQRLNEAIDGLGQSVVDTGLSILSSKQIAALFRQPELLLALQDLVLSACSPYWDNLLASQTRDSSPTLIASTTQLSTTIQNEKVNPNRSGYQTQRTWYLPAAISSLCTAASLVIALGIWQSWTALPTKTQTACRWSIPDLQRCQDGPQLFRQIADGATWQAEPHASAAELARDIADYRAKCSQMILTDFAFLKPERQLFLRGKCRLWAQKMDEQLVRLESQSGDDPALRQQVHAEMSTIVTNLQNALRAA